MERPGAILRHRRGDGEQNGAGWRKLPLALCRHCVHLFEEHVAQVVEAPRLLPLPPALAPALAPARRDGSSGEAGTALEAGSGLD
jgi:hypothetical protein